MTSDDRRHGVTHRSVQYNQFMSTQFLTVRLTEAEAKLVARLQVQTGLSKSALVKQALNGLSAVHEACAEGGLFALGAARFGRHGDATRQSARIKRTVRT
jgi:hypothetical protein